MRKYNEILKRLKRIEIYVKLESKFKKGDTAYKVINWLGDDSYCGIPGDVIKVKIRDIRLYNDNIRYEYYIIAENVDYLYSSEWTYYGLYSEQEIEKFKDKGTKILTVKTELLK